MPNVLVDLSASINVMNKETVRKLGLTNLWPIPTILEVANRSTIKPKGILDDLIVLVDPWEYPADFLVLQRISQLGGHPLILGRPWLPMEYAYINYRSRSMTISDGTETKILTLYPPF